MKNRFSIWLFFAFCFFISLSIYATVDWYEKHKSQLPFYGNKGNEQTIADFKLINQDGREVRLNDWKGKIVVANFFFTHCPVVCPKMTSNLKRVQAAFAGDRQIQINSFSVDPERDSSKRLKEYASLFSIEASQWNLLTGDKKNIYKLARKSFQVVAADGDGGKNDFIHSDKLVLIDTRQRIRGYYSGTESSEIQQLLIDIKRLKHEN